MPAHKKAHSRRSSSHPKRSTSRRRSTTSRKKKPSRGRRWSARVTRTSHAMDTQQGIFKSKDPDKIAHSLLNSAKRSKTRKTTPYQSAMSRAAIRNSGNEASCITTANAISAVRECS